MLELKIHSKDNDIQIPIKKDNKLLIINNQIFFTFYSYFYKSLYQKSKEIELKIGNKLLDNKNSILLSLCDYSEILEQLSFKKGTLFYNYIETLIVENDTLNSELLLYDLNNILNDIVLSSKLNINQTVDEDIEKLIFSITQFNLNYNITNINEILNNLLEQYIKINTNKIILIFYDSSLLNLSFSSFDNCYTFDISESVKIEEYNITSWHEVTDFNYEIIIHELNKQWPIAFNEQEIMKYIKEYFIKISHHIELSISNEKEYLAYFLLNKLYNNSIPINTNQVVLNDNIKSFLEHI